MGLKGGLDSINPVPDRDNFRAQVQAEMNFRVLQNGGNFVTIPEELTAYQEIPCCTNLNRHGLRVCNIYTLQLTQEKVSVFAFD